MLFFTPELYRRFNSQDDEIALAADAEWEAAIVRYRQHLASLYEKMPSQVMEVSKLCLHDGEMLQRQEQEHPLGIWRFDDRPGSPPFWPVWYGMATLPFGLMMSW
jgi:hypothetical protein